MADITYLQAISVALLQGITELFPVSSLGHSVLVPALLGGSWAHLVTESSTPNSEQSPYLAFIVALHVATALALLFYYRDDWIRIISGFLHTLKTRRVETSSERLAWLLVVATIPVGITGLLLEHTFRALFAKPLAAAIFLTLNGLILLAGEAIRRRSEVRQLILAHATHATDPADQQPARRLDTLDYKEAAVIGLFQTFALLAGISRSGITLVGGLVRGLDHEDAAKFAFLLATPVIFAAGVLKLPVLAGPAGHGIHGQILIGALIAAVSSYLSIKFLTRYFQTRTLIPFAIYCLAGGLFCVIYFA
ncbi:MAG TPA: undecaprenyl-diphosphate phosphatase [Pseudonocardiaceae bacterium]